METPWPDGHVARLCWFPSSCLGTQFAKLQLRELGSWSFPDCIPKLELGNELNSLV